MNYEELIGFLVDEIYKRIQGENIKESSLKKKKSIVLIGESNVSSYKKALKDFYINPLTSECEDCDILLISKLCIRGLSNIAQGAGKTKAENFVLEMLLKGKKVYVLEDGIEYRKYKNTAPKVLYNKYLKYEEELLSYGIEIIDNLNKISEEDIDYNAPFSDKKEDKNTYKECNLLDKEDKKVKNNSSLDEYTIDLSNKRLISEGDLRKPHINGVKKLIVSKKAIITPLAKDYIRINNLKVILS